MMPSWSRFSEISHRASIAGKVVCAVTGSPLQGVSVTMNVAAAPLAFQSFIAARSGEHGARWATLEERPDRTKTARDGCFRFVDLPSGAYPLLFAMPGSEGRYGTTTAVFDVPGSLVSADAQGHVVIAATQILLPVTGATGLIQGGDATTPMAPLSMARVRVRGSGELAYGDEGGRFTLARIEPGHRVLEFTASGHEAHTTTIMINRGEVVDIGSIVLAPLPP